ncbi:carbon-nitrogen hydrolase family protein [Niveibacterium sp. 24ML]|uniref:carbon-nitrogen hydrolase family protein n=1 Tax=Niveibacterium sp. 24ML TaxID=2985512 RepID=UPI00226E26FC|nr:carbon-nitrogen hydrolase family protein [Niveibacterium sp. 24ML]MCX9157643.1 carbon-nitrogen hydrolase family protein [Niveibacterium sp. 24ML]
MSQRYRVAAVQMVSGPDVGENLREAERLIAEAAAGGAQLVVLPEYFALISPDEQAKFAVCEAEGDGPMQRFLADTARRYKVWLVGGTIPLRAQSHDKVRNAVLVFDDAGQRVARYDKLHLFGFRKGNEAYDESRTIEAGAEIVTFDAPFGRVGLAVCYDLRFPELFRAMGDLALIVLPAAFTETTGRAHWEVLLRARAVENLCYVLASAQGGEHPGGRRTWGESMLIDPWGAVLQHLPRGAGVVIGEIDPEHQRSLRESLPALQHRRL